MRKPEEHFEAHRAAGERFDAGGLKSFVRREGNGQPVVCLHGVPASSFLYRKVLAELARCRLQGIAFDLPGLGLADRPPGFDYTFTGLGAWAVQAVDSLTLDRFHLVIHDIGGPIGLELASRIPDRVQSLTILNTIILGLDGFEKPWAMRPFGWPLLGRLYLAAMSRFMFTRMMYLMGVSDKSACTAAEAAVYVDLLKCTDRGAAFLQIMQRFETTRQKEALYIDTVKSLACPKQFIWGRDDTALPVQRYGRPSQAATGVNAFHLLPSKHFLQEDQAPAIANLVAAQAGLGSPDSRLS